MKGVPVMRELQESEGVAGVPRRVGARIAGVVGAVTALIIASAMGASAASTDPTGGAGDTFFTALQSYLTGHLIAAVLGLAVIGVAVSMLLSWGKRAAKSK